MNAGRVELDLVAVGKDQVSAMLRQVEAQAKKTGGELQTLGEQANRAAPKVTSLGPAVGEAAKKFTTMSAAIVGGVIGGGISGVVGALTELGIGLAGAVIDFLKTEPRLDAFSAGVIAATNDAAKLTSQIAAVGKAADTASKQVAGMASKTASVYGRIARLNGDAALAAGFERQALLLAGADSINEIETQMQAAERAANAAQTRLRSLAGPLEKARLDVVAANEALKYRRQQGLDDTVQAQQLGLLANKHALLASQVAMSAEAYRIADASVVEFSDHLAALDTLQGTIASPRAQAEAEATRSRSGGRTRAPVDTSALPYMSDEGSYIREGGDALKQTFENARDTSAAEAARALAAMRDDAGKLADELGRVADATQLVATVMPEMSAALDEVQGITAKIAEGKLSLAEALAQGATAIAANAAKAIGGVRAEAAVRAAYEIGMGFATLATPVISAGHFTAGALLGAVALGAGGGSGGSKASSGGSAGYVPDSPSKGGGTTIWNISTLVTDPHTLQRANASSARATRGTGIDERSAA